MNPIKKISELVMRLTGATNENDVDPDEEAYNEALKSVPYAQRGMTPPPFPTEEDDFEPQAPSRPPKRTPTAPAVSTKTDPAKPAEGSRPNTSATGGAKMNTGALEELRRNAQAAQDRRAEESNNILTPEETPATPPTPAPTPVPKPAEAKQPDAVDSLTAFVSAYAEAKNARAVLPLWKVGTHEDGTPVLRSREQMQAFFGVDPSMEKAEYYFADSVTAGKPVKAPVEVVRRYRLKTALHEAGLL